MESDAKFVFLRVFPPRQGAQGLSRQGEIFLFPILCSLFPALNGPPDLKIPAKRQADLPTRRPDFGVSARYHAAII